MARKADTIVNGIGTGPSWYDAWSMVREMEKHHGISISLTMASCISVPRQWGWHVTASVKGNEKVYGCGSFGPAYPGNGQKSYAAAVYRALLALDEELAKDWLGTVVVQQEKLHYSEE